MHKEFKAAVDDDGDDNFMDGALDRVERAERNYKAALDLLEDDFCVVPQKAINMKRPGVDWKELQSRLSTLHELESWRSMFANGVGIITGAVSNCVVIDVDGPEGEALLKKFEKENGPLPETLTARSGSGRGRHLYFEHPGGHVKTYANTTDKIDVKGDGGYCVAPPSLHKSGGRYEFINEVEMAPMPEGLLKFLAKAERAAKAREKAAKAKAAKAEAAGSGSKPPAQEALAEFRATLAIRNPELDAMFALDANIPPMNENAARDDAGGMAELLKFLVLKGYFPPKDYHAWCECGMALKPAYGDEVGQELWAITHCDEEARKAAPEKWKSFRSEYREGDVTVATLIGAARELGYEGVVRAPLDKGAGEGEEAGAGEEAGEAQVAADDLNRNHFVAKLGGNVLVFDERDDQKLLAGGMRPQAFRDLYGNRRDERGAPVAPKWLASESRRTYDRIVFDPSGKPTPGAYNMFKGLAVKPVEGCVERMLSHICEVWCGNDPKQFDYVIKWLAMLVQKPWIKPRVALVLRSKEGTGKTMLTRPLLDIFGQHGFTTTQKEQVAGRFNSHLFDKVLVVLEEAFFAGDHAASNAVKALVTNEMMGYEAKGSASFTGPSCAHVILCTNEDWSVPAGGDARRWMVLDVSEARIGDHAYFEGLAAEIENGGASALLHHLLEVDIKGFNPDRRPPSKGLRKQQAETLLHRDPIGTWWLGVLADGDIGGDGDWPETIPTDTLREHYERATRGTRSGAPPFDVAMRKLAQLLPDRSPLHKSRPRAGGGLRFHVYTLPDLQEARAAFTKETGVDPTALE